MLKDLNYIIFDLETTGLNIKKDEPIQIGILNFDKNFNIKNYFSSYIKPKKDIKQLKDIVSLITGIKLQDLQTAPNIEQIIKKVKPFFEGNKDNIIIGHNIIFDINILSKYYKLNYFLEIDTFPLSKILLHFLPSYSLEILIDFINENNEFENFIKNLNIPNLNPHDALYDSLMNFFLFKSLIQNLENLINKYPIIKYFISNSNIYLKQILELPQIDKPKQLFLPPLKKEINDNKNLYNNEAINLKQFNNFQKIYIGNIFAKNLAKKLLHKENKLILSFSNKGKLNLFKNILQNQGIKNIGFLTNEVIFDENKIKNLLHKKHFENFEVEFLIKYFSQYDLGHSFLDINKIELYRVFQYLKNEKEKKLPKIILTTHRQLFEYINTHKEKIKDYTILFFDWDNWYQEFKKYIIEEIDLYNLLSKLENIVYNLYIDKDTNYSLITKIYNQFNIFIGIFFMEITKLFKGKQINKIEIGPILEDIDFWKTNKIYNHLQENINLLLNQSNFRFKDELKEILDKLNFILNNIIQINLKVYQEDKFYFTFTKINEVIDYQRFLEIFSDIHTLFLTNYSKENTEKISQESKEYIKKVRKTSNINDLIKNIIDGNNYIVVKNKEDAKKIIKILIEKGYDKNFKILAENITGGKGKLIYQSKKNGNKIIIGGYQLVFNILNETKINKILTFNIAGPLEKQIIIDINRWWNID